MEYTLTLQSVPLTLPDHINTPDRLNPLFHVPLLHQIKQDAEVETCYRKIGASKWSVYGELPECLYERKTIPETIRKQFPDTELPY